MDDLKNNYKVDIIPISDDNAEDDWPIAKYRLSKKSNEKEEQPKEEKLEKEGQLPPEVKDIYGFISEDT